MNEFLTLTERIIDRLLALEGAVFWSGVAVWVALSLAVAALASGRGQTGIGFFLLAVLLSPAVGLVVLLLMPDKRLLCLNALEARVAMLEGQAGVIPPPEQVADYPMIPGGGRKGNDAAMWVVMAVLVVIVVIGSISQLGASANTTFGQVSTAMDGPPR